MNRLSLDVVRFRHLRLAFGIYHFVFGSFRWLSVAFGRFRYLPQAVMANFLSTGVFKHSHKHLRNSGVGHMASASL